MKHYFDVRFAGTVDGFMQASGEPETIDDIRGVVLESFRPDLQPGVTIELTSVTVYEMPQLESTAKNDKTSKE